MERNGSRATRPVVVVQGSDDAGSAVARELHVAGYAVVVTDDADPPWPRRGMSYVDAWYVGGATLSSVDACFCSSVRSIPAVLARGDMIAATTWSCRGVASVLDVRAIFVASGAARPATSAGRDDIAVIGVERNAGSPHHCTLAPRAGRFSTRFEIAERVGAGELLGEVAGHPVVAPAGGVLRGLSARGARVAAGQCIVEIDTDADPHGCFGIEPGARRVAERAVAALRRVSARADLPTDTARRALA